METSPSYAQSKDKQTENGQPENTFANFIDSPEPTEAKFSQIIKPEQPDKPEKLPRRTLYGRIGAIALATALATASISGGGNPFKSFLVKAETQNDLKNPDFNQDDQVAEVMDQDTAPDGSSEEAESTGSDEIIVFVDDSSTGAQETPEQSNPIQTAETADIQVREAQPEEGGTVINVVIPSAATTENGGTTIIVPTGATPTTNPFLSEKKATKSRSEKQAVQKQTQQETTSVEKSTNFVPITNFNTPTNIISPIADGLDVATRTAFAEGAYVSEEAARAISDVIINRALKNGTSVGAEVAAKGQFEAYANGTKGKGNWGWREYGSGPQNGSIGTERVQQIFMEELAKATSGQPLANNYTRFSASGDGRTNIYH